MSFLLFSHLLAPKPFVFETPWRSRLFPNRIFAHSIFVPWPIIIILFCLLFRYNTRWSALSSCLITTCFSPPFHPYLPSSSSATLPPPAARWKFLFTMFWRHSCRRHHPSLLPNHTCPWSSMLTVAFVAARSGSCATSLTGRTKENDWIRVARWSSPLSVACVSAHTFILILWIPFTSSLTKYLHTVREPALAFPDGATAYFWSLLLHIFCQCEMLLCLISSGDRVRCEIALKGILTSDTEQCTYCLLLWWTFQSFLDIARQDTKDAPNLYAYSGIDIGEATVTGCTRSKHLGSGYWVTLRS